jgi:hypothetical protein
MLSLELIVGSEYATLRPMPHVPSEPGNVSRHILPESGNASRLRSVIMIIVPIVTSVALLGAAPLWWHPLARIFHSSSAPGPVSPGITTRVPASGRIAGSPAHRARPSTSQPSVAPSVHTSSASYHAPAPVNPPPTAAAASTPTSPAPSRTSKTVLVYGKTPATPIDGGQSTGVELSRGQKLDLAATGQVIYGYEGTGSGCVGYPLTDPAGNRISSATGQPCGKKIDNNPAMPSQTLPVGSLLWRVGESGWSEVGAFARITAPDPGQLFLCVNDDTVQDNDRFFTVTLNS